MTRRACTLAAGALLAPTLLAAQQAPTPTALSLGEAVTLAQQNNPEYLQQKNDLGVARWSVRSAYGNLLPSASASTNFGYTAAGVQRYGSVELGRTPENYSSSYRLGLSYEVSGSTLLQPSVERAQARAVGRRVSGTEARLVAQVSQQYLTALQAREQVQQAEREVARTAEHVRLAQARLDVGAGTPLDVRRAEVQQGRAEVSLVQARNAHATALLTLGQLMGVPLDPSARLTSDFAVFDPNWETEALVASAMQTNPLLLAARASADAAKTSIKAARSSYLPRLNFNVGLTGYAQKRGDENLGYPFDYARQPFSGSVGLSLPLFTGFSRQLQVEQAEANAEDARYQVRAEELRLRQEVGAALLNLETAYQTALLQERVRETAAEELRLAEERFRFGAASSVEVTDAQTNLAQAEKDQIDAVYDFHKSLAALEALVGQPLR
jgi:outer membrane protein